MPIFSFYWFCCIIDKNSRVTQKYQSCEFRPGSFTGDARLVTDIKYINKNLHKLTQATPIEFLYFLYIAFTDYYSTTPCIRQTTQGIRLFPSVAGKLFYFLPPGVAHTVFSFIHTAHITPHKARNTSKKESLRNVEKFPQPLVGWVLNFSTEGRFCFKLSAW